MKLKQLFIFSILAIANTGCMSGEQSCPSVIPKEYIPIPIIIDTIGIVKSFHGDTSHPTWKSTAEYKIYFIGKAEDTIYTHYFTSYDPPPIPGIKREDKPYKHPYEKYLRSEEYETTDTAYISSNLIIQIDTSKIIAASYPVFITNPDTFYAFVAYGDFIPMIMEALDSNGVWQPIQERFMYFCGTGLREVVLPPNESVVTVVPIFQGDYVTSLRLKLEDNYSMPFNGRIYYRQFRSRYDKNGNYNAAYLKETEPTYNN